MRAWPEEQFEQLRQLFNEGLPTTEIGRRLGLTKSAVIGKLHRSGLAGLQPEPEWYFLDSQSDPVHSVAAGE